MIMKRLIYISLIFLVFSCNTKEPAKKVSIDTLAPTPPMGWNSWLTYGTDIRENEVKEAADYMAANLKQYGWEYVVVDLGWYSSEKAIGQEYYKARPRQVIDGYGRLIPDTIKFPSAKGGKGFGPLADYIHRKGLKFGIHIMRGIPYSAAEKHNPVLHTNYYADEITRYDEGCTWYDGMRTVDMSQPGGQAYYNSLIELYASWGVDFIKADDMQLWPYHYKEVEGVHNAIEKVGRPIVLSLSPGGPPFNERNHPIKYSNMYRITGDFWDSWKDLVGHFDVCKQYELYQKPNHWADCDLLPIGKINLRSESGLGERDSKFTKDEQYLLITLWSIFKSPLFLGNNLPLTDKFTLSLITNNEVIEVDQHSENNRQLFSKDSTIAWIADIGHVEKVGKYLAIFNLSSKSKEITVTINDLGLSGSCLIRDLWEKKDIGLLNEIKTSVNTHGAKLYRITKQ
jgi:alpha-galactosidase